MCTDSERRTDKDSAVLAINIARALYTPPCANKTTCSTSSVRHRYVGRNTESCAPPHLLSAHPLVSRVLLLSAMEAAGSRPKIVWGQAAQPHSNGADSVPDAPADPLSAASALLDEEREKHEKRCNRLPCFHGAQGVPLSPRPPPLCPMIPPSPVPVAVPQCLSRQNATASAQLHTVAS